MSLRPSGSGQLTHPITMTPTRPASALDLQEEFAYGNSLTDKARLLIERPVSPNVATVDSHGQPQLTPVWIDLDGDNLVFNTAKGRAKDRNLRDPQVAVSVVDPEDQYNVVVVRGSVESTEKGADAHIDSLAKKYLGVDNTPMRKEGEVRVIYRVIPDHVVMQPTRRLNPESRGPPH